MSITRGTDNVFADLSYPDAADRQTKLRLAYAINEIIKKQRWTQDEAARRLGTGQPKVSALARYRLEGFSVERLMAFLVGLDHDVEIVIRKSRAHGGRHTSGWFSTAQRLGRARETICSGPSQDSLPAIMQLRKARKA